MQQKKVLATSGTYTITAPATSHQYEIYQIFTGDLHEGTLSNLKWGKNGKETEGTDVAAAVVTALTGVTGKSFNEILAVVEPYANLNSTPIATVTNGATYEAVAGYYLIKDKDNSVTGTDSYTLYIVKVVGNVTIDPKSDVPSLSEENQGYKRYRQVLQLAGRILLTMTLVTMFHLSWKVL